MSDIWNYLSENNINIVVENLPEDYQCGLCEKILINPIRSKCKCVFCKSCITAVMKLNQCLCPVCLKKESLFTIYKNDLKADEDLNAEIQNLCVKCPRERCEISCQISELLQHIRSCYSSDGRCMFGGLGCIESELTETELVEHLRDFENQHRKLTVDSVRLLKEKVQKMAETDSELKLELEQLKAQNDELSRTVKERDNSISEHRDQITELRNEMTTIFGELKSKYLILENQSRGERKETDSTSKKPVVSTKASNFNKTESKAESDSKKKTNQHMNQSEGENDKEKSDDKKFEWKVSSLMDNIGIERFSDPFRVADEGGTLRMSIQYEYGNRIRASLMADQSDNDGHSDWSKNSHWRLSLREVESGAVISSVEIGLGDLLQLSGSNSNSYVEAELGSKARQANCVTVVCERF